MSSDLLTTKQAADLLGVGTTSIKRWADEGVLRCVKTAGGHRRIPRAAIAEYLRQRTDEAPAARDHEVSDWVDQLLVGMKASAVEQKLEESFNELGSFWRVAESLGPVITEIGNRWQIGRINVLAEHLASSRLARGITRLTERLALHNKGPRCLLVAAPGDDHTLGLSLVELCLAEAGLITQWAGRRTPVEYIIDHAAQRKIEIIAVSASVYSIDGEALSAFVDRVGPVCKANGIHLILGGNGLWPPRPSYGHRFHEFSELAAWLSETYPQLELH